MYATCLFCHAALGRNESFEQFPIGRRLAYDASKGRLWVVCTKCARWNLSPIEERWEAIESAERVYRDTKKRVATDNIGLARLRDGTDLIRIGAPLRPEFAAWRYGANFSKRHKKGLLFGAAGVVVGAGVIGGAISISGGSIVSAALMSYNYLHSAHTLRHFLGRKINRITITANDGVRIRIPRPDAGNVILNIGKSTAEGASAEPSIHFLRSGKERGGSKQLVKFEDGYRGWVFTDKTEIVRGPAAFTALGQILPALNTRSGAPSHVSQAVSILEESNSVPQLLQSVSHHTRRPTWYSGKLPQSTAFALANLTTPARLALEMSLHEADERRAMEGDLLELEQRWKEAEEIAGIADSLTLSPASERTLADYKAKSHPGHPDSPSRSD